MLLAFQDMRATEAVIARGLTKVAPNTITDPEELRRSLPTRLETHTVRPEKVDELDPLTYEVVRHRLWSVTEAPGRRMVFWVYTSEMK